MSIRNSADVGFFLVGGRSLLGSLTSVLPVSRNQMRDATTLGVAAPVKQPNGLSEFVLSQDGWFDPAAGGANEALADARGRTSQVICVGLEGNVVGRGMIGAAGAYVGNYQRSSQVGEFQRASATYELSGIVEDLAVVVATLAARTTASHTQATPADNAASSAAGGAAYLQVSALALDGYTDLVVKVRHSADGITWADLLTMTAVTASPAAERKTVAGTVERYLAISWAWTGAGTAPSATFLVGFARG